MGSASLIILAVSIAYVLLPGALMAFVPKESERKTESGTEFAIDAIFFGIMFAGATSLVMGLMWWIDIGPGARYAIAGLIGYGAIGIAWKTGRENGGVCPRIRPTWYDGAVFFMIAAIIAISVANIRQPALAEYRNFSSDQYHWFGYIERFLADPISIYGQFLDPINRSGFFLVAAPYLAFMPENAVAEQMLILGATLASRASWALAGAYAGYALLPIPAMGILIPPAIFAFNWTNYYATYAGAIPQNLALYLFIAGFAWMGKASARKMIALIFAMGLIHLPTLTVFLIIMSVHNLMQWNHLAEKKDVVGIMTIPVGVVVMARYGLYALGWLPFRDPLHIAYYARYMKPLYILSQAYTGPIQKALIYGGIASMPLIAAYAIRKKGDLRLGGVVLGVLLTALFAKTSWLAYHAFYASWQPFRFLIFFYPLLAIIVAGGIGIIIRAGERVLNKSIAVFATAFTIMALMPPLMAEMGRQEANVVRDMITGSDDGATERRMASALEELKGIGREARALEWPIVFLSGEEMRPYAERAFGARALYMTRGACDNYETCSVMDPISMGISTLKSLTPAILVIEKESMKGPTPGLGLHFTEREGTDYFKVFHSR